MGRVKITDVRVAEDARLLKRMRKKSSLDFVQWTDDAASMREPLKRTRIGLHSTLHSVSGPDLAKTPESILDRPVAGLEFATDYVAKEANTEAEQVHDLIQTYLVFHRRLAPWKGRFVTTRMGRSPGRSQYDKIITGKAVAGVREDGSVWIKELPRRWIKCPQEGPSTIIADTVYFGHRVRPSWTGYRDHPQVQVRLYIKVTDDGKALPRSKWRVRVEVTLNAVPLATVLGVRCVRDLLTADMRTLVHEYTRLMSPREDSTFLKAPNVPSRHRAMLERSLAFKARQDRREAEEWGNFSGLEDGLIEFLPVATLDSPVLASANDFRRAVQRAKKVKTAGLSGGK